MVLDIKKFSGLTDLNAHIKGKIRGSVDLNQVGSALYLHGKTLIFTTPAATVTFAASPTAAQVPLTKAQVKTQIEAQATGVTCNFVGGRLELFMATPGAIVLTKDGTANPLLGFNDLASTTGTPVNPAAGAAPKFVALTPEGTSGTYLLVTDV